MKRIVMGCAVAAMVALSVRTEGRPNESFVSATEHVAPKPVETTTEIGVASWYGEQFQGNPTASGEIFDMNGLTAASRVLPLGTRIKVTNLKNNRSLILKVNDRGPYVSGRFLDVSKAAARQLGFMNAGLARVETQIISSPRGFAARLNAPAPQINVAVN